MDSIEGSLEHAVIAAKEKRSGIREEFEQDAKRMCGPMVWRSEQEETSSHKHFIGGPGLLTDSSQGQKGLALGSKADALFPEPPP